MLRVFRQPTLQQHAATHSVSVTKPETKLKPLKDMPGPKGLPVVGVLWDYMKKDGYKFNKMFLGIQFLSVFNAHAPVRNRWHSRRRFTR